MVKGSKLEVGPGKWRLRVGAGKDPVSGRYLVRSERFNGSAAQAEKRLRALVNEVEKAKDIGPSTMTTVTDLFDAWWPVAKANLFPVHRQDSDRPHRDHHQAEARLVPLAKLNAALLDRFYGELLARGSAKGGPLAPASVRRVHNVVASALGRAVKWGWLPRSPASAATPPALPVRRVVPPDPDQVRDIIEESKAFNPIIPVFLRVAAVTGARRSEVVALRWSDVNFDKAKLTIAHGVVVDVERKLVLKDTKTHAVRTISLGADMLAMLVDLRAAQAKTAADLGMSLVRDPFLFSFAADASEPWNPEYVTRAVSRIKDSLGYDKVA